ANRWGVYTIEEGAEHEGTVDSRGDLALGGADGAAPGTRGVACAAGSVSSQRADPVRGGASGNLPASGVPAVGRRPRRRRSRQGRSGAARESRVGIQPQAFAHGGEGPGRSLS